MKKIYRSKTNRVIAGIFGGIAEVYGIDPKLLRLLAVFAALASGIVPAIITYLIAWIIIPQEP